LWRPVVRNTTLALYLISLLPGLRFYYFFVLATPEEQEAMNRMWQSKWRIDFWNGPRRPCRTTGVLDMQDVLRVSFGQSWTPPSHRLQLKHVP
jgi:hypothetical protein